MLQSLAHSIRLALVICLPLALPAVAGETKEVEVNGVRIPYIEAGKGEPVVFIHGAISDMRVWEKFQDKFADKYRFITYTQRYFGKGDWPDKGDKFGVVTLGNDVIGFLKALNTGPANLVGWSYGGAIAVAADLQDPSLIKSMVLYEPTIDSLIDKTSEGKAAAESGGKMFGPVGKALEAGDSAKATKMLIEGVFQMKPGGFDGQDEALKTMQLDNARTVPIMWNAMPWDVTCDKLKKINTPTLIISGQTTTPFFSYIADRAHDCIPKSELTVFPNAGHEGPVADVDGFTKLIKDFIAKQ